jgi:hypothetical protein
MDCATVAKKTYSHWCHSVCYHSAGNKIKTKLLFMSLVMCKHLIIHADIWSITFDFVSPGPCLPSSGWCSEYTTEVSTAEWNPTRSADDDVTIYKECVISRRLNMLVSVAECSLRKKWRKKLELPTTKTGWLFCNFIRYKIFLLATCLTVLLHCMTQSKTLVESVPWRPWACVIIKRCFSPAFFVCHVLNLAYEF